MTKKENKSQKLYVTDYNLLIAQHLRQGPYQILLILLLKEFIKLNVRHDDKESETFGIKYKDYKCFLQYENLI